MISLRTILLGTLTRFLPALILGTALLYGLARLADRVVVAMTPWDSRSPASKGPVG